MLFKCLALVAVALSINQAQAVLTAKDVTNGLHNITELSTDTLDVVEDLNTTNVDANGLKAVQNFRQIVADAANETADIVAASGSPTFANDEQKDICDTFTGFVKAQQDLLQTLIGQKSLLSSIPLSMPLGAVLRFVDAGVEKLSRSIIGLVPTCADESEKELKGLNETFKSALKTYPIKLHLPGEVGTQIDVPVEAPLEDQ